MRLSIAIIARDEERHIGSCLESMAGLADEVVVLLDDRSRDGTAAICRQWGATVHVEPWRGFPAQRNRALSFCQGDWVLFIDADERVTPELRRELQEMRDKRLEINQSDAQSPIANRQSPIARLRSPVSGLPSPVSRLRSPVSDPPPPVSGYWIPRYNLFFGQRLRGGGWYPDHQLRLLRRTQARYDEERLVHELVQLDGETAHLQGHLLHLNIERLGEFWRKQTSYALSEARTLAREGRHTRWRNFIGAPAREFQRRYISLGGWRDGPLGLFLCAALAWFELVKFAFLLGLGREERSVKRET
ncbi:MAG: glycosyltransferase family 2 protein [Chloroflexaceae bacterium]|nr:glycosyltransferase family 2 protein [Chloroflexaceae bacterium]